MYMIYLFPFLNIFVQGFLWGSSQRCYDHIGCFSNAKPFNNAQRHLPDTPDHIQTTFRLYTRQNPTAYQLLKPFDANSVTNSHFNGHHKTVFIIHGFNDNGGSHWVTSMIAALLKKENMNVIMVDWSRGADYINYYQAAANTRVVGALLGKMMNQLHGTSGTSYGRMHLIGHSLGSHIAGYAGHLVHGTGRITGLDPAGPCFEEQDVLVRLDPHDAVYVDVIHTDGDSLLQLGFGCDRALGHADFYPNGGEDQPGCPGEFGSHVFSLITGNIEKLKDGIACSHMRVLDFFIESINSCTFTSYPCTSKKNYDAGSCRTCGGGCVIMGYNSSPHTRGKFFLPTNAVAPYCKH